MEINYDQINSKKFNDYFLKEIAPKLKQAESIRKNEFEKFKNACIICYSIYVALAYAFLSEIFPNISMNGDTAEIVFNLIGILFIFFAIASIWPWNIMDKYKKEMKLFLYPSLLKFIGDFKFSEERLAENEIEDYKLFNGFNHYSKDDTILGNHKGLDVGIYEIELERESGSGKSRSRVQVFKGLLCKFEINKKFRGHTIVLQDKGWFNKFNGKNGLKNVKLEDPMFEKEFEVFADDQIESRYLLTTAFMQRLLDLKEKFNADISCTFHRNELIIAIPCTQSVRFKGFKLPSFISNEKNFFELPNIFKSLNNIIYFKNVIAEILYILSIIDTLKLEQDIGM